MSLRTELNCRKWSGHEMRRKVLRKELRACNSWNLLGGAPRGTTREAESRPWDYEAGESRGAPHQGPGFGLQGSECGYPCAWPTQSLGCMAGGSYPQSRLRILQLQDAAKAVYIQAAKLLLNFDVLPRLGTHHRQYSAVAMSKLPSVILKANC